MNEQKVQESAKKLQQLLSQYASTNDSAAALQKSLSPLLQSAILGTLIHPLDTKVIPGGRTFDETDARCLPGLEKAYAQFTMAASGGEPAALKLFRQRHGIDAAS